MYGSIVVTPPDENRHEALPELYVVELRRANHEFSFSSFRTRGIVTILAMGYTWSPKGTMDNYTFERYALAFPMSGEDNLDVVDWGWADDHMEGFEILMHTIPV